MSKHAILYLNIGPSERIPQMTLAGIRRYAAVRGWEAEAFSPKESRVKAIPVLLASRAPVAGCIYDCGDDNIPASPSVFGAVPVVYLHAEPPPRGIDGIVRIPTDNDAVAVAAFRELSLGRPAAYAVVGVPETFGWSFVRVKRFCEEVKKVGSTCSAFPRIDGERASARAARLAAWLKALPRKTAIFAVNDLTAAEVVAAARVALRAIPRELTLIGVDNLPQICEASTPTISSIQIDYERVGYVAARMIGEGAISAPTSVGPLLAVRRRSTGGSGRRETFILEAVEMIRREACDGLTVERLVKRFPCSRRLFEMRFREAVGHSALDEIMNVRLERAMDLLAHTDMPIEAVAHFCGFRREWEFWWLFKKRTERTPLQFRKARR